MTAKICGYVAPGLAACVVVWLLGESCTKGGCWSGKCIPSLLMMGTVACQGLTFIIYNSDLFCKNEDIKQCALGAAAYTSIQACVVYAVAFILYYIAPTPKPLTGMMGATHAATVSTASTSKTGGGDATKKKKKSTPDAGEDYTKEMYEQRRKEKNIKSRGVSGRSKKEIFKDMNENGNKSKSRKEEPYDESKIVLYDPEKGQRRDKEMSRERSGSSRRKNPQPLYGDYVDEPGKIKNLSNVIFLFHK